MKKISEQTKNFLLYGIEDTIKPKEIYKLDGAILFLIFLFFFLAETTSSPVISRIFLSIVYLGFVILSFSRTEVTGKRVFWIYGIQSLTFSILFCWAGTILMLTTMKEESYKGYFGSLTGIYILAVASVHFSYNNPDKKRRIQSLFHKKIGRRMVSYQLCHVWNRRCKNTQYQS